jgi:hypothetical protein
MQHQLKFYHGSESQYIMDVVIPNYDIQKYVILSKFYAFVSFCYLFAFYMLMPNLSFSTEVCFVC